MTQNLINRSIADPIIFNSPWPHWRGVSLNNNGQSLNEGPVSNGLKWQYQTANTVSSSPVIDNQGNVYFGSGFNFYALTPLGSLKWNSPFATQGNVQTTGALDNNGAVYFGSGDFYFYAVNTTTGSYYGERSAFSIYFLNL